MTTKNKRRAGERNENLKSVKEILRFVHSKKTEIDEGEIRDFAKLPPLNISTNNNVSTHLRTLENKHKLLHHVFSGRNVWTSEVYSVINADMEKCNLPPLTEPQKKIIDFLIKYSNEFIETLLTNPSWCKSLKTQIEKSNHVVKRQLHGMNMQIFDNALSYFNNSWFLIIAEACITIDELRGNLDTSTESFINDYQVTFPDIPTDAPLPHEMIVDHLKKEKTNHFPSIH